MSGVRSLHTYVSCNHEGRLTTRMCIHAWNIHTATLPGRNTQSRSVCCDYSDEGSCCSGRWRSYLSCAFFHSVFPQEGKNKLYARLCLWLQRLYLKFDRLRERCFHKNDQKKKKIFQTENVDDSWIVKNRTKIPGDRWFQVLFSTAHYGILYVHIRSWDLNSYSRIYIYVIILLYFLRYFSCWKNQ